MLDESTFWEIEDYLQHRMSDAQRTAFEQRVSADVSLQEKLKAHQQTDADIDLYFEDPSFQNLRKQEMMEKGRQMLQEAKQKRRVRIRNISLAASLIAIVGLFFLLKENVIKSQLTPQESPVKPKGASAAVIYAQYFDTDAITESGLLGNRESTLANAKILYKNKAYTQVIDTLNDLLKDSAFTKKSNAYLLRGAAYLQLDNISEAIANFEKISPEAITFYQDGQWYTAGAYLKQENIPAAKNVLTTIRNDERHPKKEQAQEILNSLQ